jgi:hypothetical protein
MAFMGSEDDALTRLAKLYEAWGKPDEAGRYQALLLKEPEG